MLGIPLPDDIESQYNPRKAVPDVEQFTRHTAELSARARQRLTAARLDLRYGQGKLATLDVFPAAAAAAPVHVFLHGGYWRGRDKSDYSYVADALVPMGITTVVMNYDLCPAVELPAIVRQVREGFQWIHAHAKEWGGDPAAITASGHSAGAHLIAAALPQSGEATPPWVPRAATLISGIYELEPVLSISVNQEIRLRPEQVDALSPMRRPPHPSVPLVLVAGGGEPTSWVKQSHDFAKACTAAGGRATYVEVPGAHHYSVMNGLEDADGLLARLIAACAKPSNPT
ncbi:MAG: putative Esterase/lipase [Ramlibacter sp.]|jgi:arylformamidase|uniref:alpha/beta hydrolase n=1 Tax=Ramlibacter sp. TaxID=1917967 RepID=UPI002635EF1D|nr:alpha/beta hydrolase [Ramlibacter sp.]MDB5751055.1 putative Esterase/lipase [Ramlibacter sp.]